MKTQKKRIEFFLDTLKDTKSSQGVIIETLPYWHSSLIKKITSGKNTADVENKIIQEISNIPKESLSRLMVWHLKIPNWKIISNTKHRIGLQEKDYSKIVKSMDKYNEIIERIIKLFPEINYKIIKLNKDWLIDNGQSFDYNKEYIQKIIAKNIFIYD